MPALTDALAEVILPLLDVPFAFFGHSMGATIAFELARRLHREYRRDPQAFFVSGGRAPQVPYSDPITYNLPIAEFMEKLGKLGGTPPEILGNAELVELMIPMLRADLQLDQTYQYDPDSPLRCPITVYGGLQDYQVPREMLLPWKELTISRFALHMLPGDHFFLRSSQEDLLRLLNRDLREIAVDSRINNP
jgi:medium-chain acyl-[acyl-carrier-protein] hydrolase